MIKLTNLREFTREDIPTALQEYLTDKFHQIIREYALYDMDGMFSVILLAKDESSYFSDKLLEFWELLTFENVQYIHTVYVPARTTAKIFIFLTVFLTVTKICWKLKEGVPDIQQ